MNLLATVATDHANTFALAWAVVALTCENAPPRSHRRGSDAVTSVSRPEDLDQRSITSTSSTVISRWPSSLTFTVFPPPILPTSQTDILPPA